MGYLNPALPILPSQNSVCVCVSHSSWLADLYPIPFVLLGSRKAVLTPPLYCPKVMSYLVRSAGSRVRVKGLSFLGLGVGFQAPGSCPHKESTQVAPTIHTRPKSLDPKRIAGAAGAASAVRAVHPARAAGAASAEGGS